MNAPVDFESLAQTIAAEKGYAAIIPVLKKELLHYEILRALDAARILEKLVFQGGTSLRLCYGSERFSEDLDFAGGTDFDASLMTEIRSVIEEGITSRYDVKVVVRNPESEERGSRQTDNGSISVRRWQIQVITQRDRPDIPQQKIKLEVASVPAHTRSVRSLINNYAELPYGYSTILLVAEAPEEIAADKLFALPVSTRMRYRDIWDLRWLSIRPRFDAASLKSLVERKIEDYRFTGDFNAKVRELLNKLPQVIEGNEFLSLMCRFLPSQTIDETLKRPLFRTHLADSIKELYELILP